MEARKKCNNQEKKTFTGNEVKYTETNSCCVFGQIVSRRTVCTAIIHISTIKTQCRGGKEEEKKCHQTNKTNKWKKERNKLEGKRIETPATAAATKI